MLSSSFDSSHDDEGNEKLTELSYEDFDDISVGSGKNTVSRPPKGNKQKKLDSSEEKLPIDLSNRPKQSAGGGSDSINHDFPPSLTHLYRK